ncbi:F0F1 ATP synthase subunit A [Candidatus Uhrbacteria bacterium]|nr:F0F1 ATP synthase subunit A [Candidatus Uhrbacteria bacterium]
MIPVAAEKLFDVGPLPVTNSLLTGWVIVALFALLAWRLNRSVRQVPSGLQNVSEFVLERLLEFSDQVTGDRRRTRRFLPLVGGIFIFILACNWLSLLPGVGSIGVWMDVHGERELVPIFRAATSDLNLTLAMGISAVALSNIFGIFAVGFFRHWGRFVQVAGIWRAVRQFGRKPFGQAMMGLAVAFIELAVGFIELVSEAAKIVSLSLRLFGNVFAGEVLLYVFFSLIGYVIPALFVVMELVVGLVQAIIFATLTLVYLTIATDSPHGSEQGEKNEPVPANQSP